MKIALVTTTINIPEVLGLYRVIADADDVVLVPPIEFVKFFVATDLKTPRAARDFCLGLFGDPIRLDNCWVGQGTHAYKCSELIGWNCIQRRAIAVLEALKWGADIIVSIDDDNIPLNHSYFYNFRTALSNLFAGLRVDQLWFDVGELLVPKAKHRGFPISQALYNAPSFAPITKAKVGVAAGICMGDPDIDAVTRIANAPIVHQVGEVLRAGIVTDPRHTWTVFNTQNTAYLRELAPAMFCMPDLGRHDDIFASLITQRVMVERDYHVRFGPPFVWQQRNVHNLITDLRQEIEGMDHIIDFAEYLRRAPIAGISVLDDCRALVSGCALLSDHAKATAMAFYEDCEGVL